ncbi:chitobiase/beta-hexosaminidase C-terminal domain-containing protein [Pontibacter sp. G13]|uniref:chitobiase/beta-hexosaminidase C-terminal domain-containing protein n=1 Tax=Pontibacter sp. G13 TaxID=3074898 RepID=UPI002889D8A8|nr:chitobiase/beta-hexosaminidase C-terminal domain-containing protein [Pontibacter sp. G13]WNJ19838.1 chitobiase/beta-hexosaminidase C-terminal domain-containing protein [Pontibacter sp. G13]
MKVSLSFAKFPFLLGLWMWGVGILPTQAAVKLPAVFSDHMVLQQQANCDFWGWATPGERIRVLTSWDGAQIDVHADSKGEWRLQLETPEAGGPYQIQVIDADTLTLSDVYIGEVWIVAGERYVAESLGEVKASTSRSAQDRLIRVYRPEKELSELARSDQKGRWWPAAGPRMQDMSAVAYAFAQSIREELDVPVGILQIDYDQTPIYAWISMEGLQGNPAFAPEVEAYQAESREYRKNPSLMDPVRKEHPSTVFNGLISPLIPFGVRGAIWYHGESFVRDPMRYRKSLITLVRDWRIHWYQNFPFYWVQLPPTHLDMPFLAAGIRESQVEALNLPGTGMVVALDMGADFSPAQKSQTMGTRLASLALKRTYGKSVQDQGGPVLKSIQRQGQTLMLDFDHVGSELMLAGEELRSFEVASKEGPYFKARARAEGTAVRVWHPEVEEPYHVRYAFSNFPDASLFSVDGFPAAPFRTDDRPLFFAIPKATITFDPLKKQYKVALRYPAESPHIMRYTLDGNQPDQQSDEYEAPFSVNSPMDLQIRVEEREVLSEAILHLETMEHLGFGAVMRRGSRPHPSFAGGGKHSLTDGLLGKPIFDQPQWVGYGDEELEFVWDLNRRRQLDEVVVRFLLDRRHGMVPPKQITLYSSKNGTKFKQIATLDCPALEADVIRQVVSFKVPLEGERMLFLKLNTTGYAEPLPEDVDPVIMIDEVIME